MSPKPLENLLSSMVTNAVVMQPVTSAGGAGNGSGNSGGGGVVGSSSSGGGNVGGSASANGVGGGQLQPDSGTRSGSISLAMLFDFIIQRTYHELTTLADM